MAEEEEKQEKGRQRFRREIAIRDVERPLEHNIERDIQWICECLSIADNENDISVDIFKELLRATKEREGVTTREIVEHEKTAKKVTQGAVVYHLNIFVSRGIVVKEGRKYFLRSANLDEMMGELEEDMLRRMRKMRELAKH